MIAAPTDAVHDRQIAAASLRTFMHLPVRQRSAVILRDVLGYSVEEICDITSTGILAVRGALQRGRLRLRELALEGDDRAPPVLAEPERARLMAYIDRFNARDFDAVRDMLAEDVRLDLVNRLRLKGRSEVGRYFRGYAEQATGTAFQASWMVGRRSSCSIPTTPQDRRHTSFFLNGRTTAWPRFEISCSRATPSKVRKSLLSAHPSANLKGSEDRERCRGDPHSR